MAARAAKRQRLEDAVGHAGHIKYSSVPVQWFASSVSLLASRETETAEAREVMKEFMGTIPNTHETTVEELCATKCPVTAHIRGLLGPDRKITVAQKTPYSAVDVVAFYIDTVTRALSVYVGFKESRGEVGWVLPGSYISVAKGDITAEDTALRVIKNELGINGEVRLRVPVVA